jgi:hypothetical protein
MLEYVLVGFYIVGFLVILINLLGGSVRALQIMMFPMIILSILIEAYSGNVTVCGIIIFFIIVVNLMGVAVIVADIMHGYKDRKRQ